ncbi:transporter [Nannocystaceae bacterium ST9]
MVWPEDGEAPSPDPTSERPASGTEGSEHMASPGAGSSQQDHVREDLVSSSPAHAVSEAAPAISLPEKAIRDAEYEAQFAVPAAPTIPHPPGRQNIFNRPLKNHEWDAMEIINTDRPDFTDVLPTVKKYMWQTESGYSFSVRERRGGDADYAYNRHRLPETLLRYGLTERLELRVRWDSAIYTNRFGTANTEPGLAWSGELTVGVKWQAILQDGWKPAHSFMAVLSTRGSDGNVTHAGFEPGLNWIYGWQIRKFMVLRGSTGFEYVAQLGQPSDGDEFGSLGTITLHQSVVTYLQWVPRLGSYTEWFSFYDFGHERGYQHNFGQGFYIYLTPNVQIDVRVAGTGFYAGDRFRDLTTGAGLSLRGFYHKRNRELREQKQAHSRRKKAAATSLAI